MMKAMAVGCVFRGAHGYECERICSAKLRSSLPRVNLLESGYGDASLLLRCQYTCIGVNGVELGPRPYTPT